ncbi:Sulfotransferase domain [Popillia japonica]|uniref:Sulfotransferase domain n=1 Tax=Popillia japonica TaxID=7064 RepID=A0AAW1KJ81_POPJA
MPVESATDYRKRLYELKNEIKLDDYYGTFKGTVLIDNFRKEQPRIEKFECRDNDVWVTSFPKSGTTWAQEMVWLLANNLDYNGAKDSLENRYTFLEGVALAGAYFKTKLLKLPIPDPISKLKKTKKRRFIKSHLPWDLLPAQIREGNRKSKIIHVVRNPKDVCVSFYHHTKIFPNLYVSMEEYFDKFISDKFLYSPYWNGVLSYWNKRHLPNVLIIRYEDMVNDLPSIIHQIADFLDTSVNEEDMGRLLHHLSFDQMKNNKAVNLEQVTDLLKKHGMLKAQYSLMRKGKVGSYKEELTEEMISLLEVWSEINNKDTGLVFDT